MKETETQKIAQVVGCSQGYSTCCAVNELGDERAGKGTAKATGNRCPDWVEYSGKLFQDKINRMG